MSSIEIYCNLSYYAVVRGKFRVHHAVVNLWKFFVMVMFEVRSFWLKYICIQVVRYLQVFSCLDYFRVS